MNRTALSKSLFAFAAAASLTSCASVMSRSTEGKLFDREGVDVILTPADTQTVYFKDLGSRERYCRSPQPDTASTFSEGISVAGPIAGGRGLGEDAARARDTKAK